MEKSDKGPEEPISEVGSEGQNRPPSEASSTGFLNSMEALFTRLLAATTQSASSVNHTNMVQLLPFNPDDADADVEGWCRVTEIIVNSKKLSGVDLLVALTSALKGRAAATLTKVRLDELTWDTVKQVLMAKFCQPKLIQDYFDDILRFQIGAKESASESAMRLWSLIERIPKVEMTEEVITGFVISVLCLRDNLIRRELNSSAIVTRAQLFRTLGSISLKRRAEPSESHIETDQKRPRLSESKFHGICHRCGVSGHKQIDCRRPRQDTSSLRQASSSSLDQANIKPSSMSCYTCGKPGHVSTACPEKRSGGSAVKEVNTCEHRTSRGTLTASSGENIPFLFDSGSSCSLLKDSLASHFQGTERNSLVFLNGLGGDNRECTRQVFSAVKIGDLALTLLFHIVPDNFMSEPVIVGRDIFENNVRVEINNDDLFIVANEEVNTCANIPKFDFTSVDTDLEGDDKEKLVNILKKYSDNFIEGNPTKRVNTGQMEINLIDPQKIVKRNPYRLAPSEKQVVREKVQELLAAGIIRESTSAFSSPILLVKKKDNSDRMCVDYRELNSNTQPEHYPLPLIEDQIDQLSGAHFFSSLDMAAGFHQILIHPDSVEKTAFVTPEGQYEYLAMPFGLRNAPSVYQRCINNALRELKDKPLVYMDDVLCYSSNIPEGLDRLDLVLGALSKAGFSLNLQKCSFMKRKVIYLGNEIQSGEVRPNTLKVQALIDAPSPKTATQVRQFLGLASYFRKFIPNFTRLVGPLYPLTKLKGPIKWTEKCEEIRRSLIQILTSEPVLTIFDPDLPVELHCDASSEGYGAIVIQKKNGMPHVIAYFSRRTTDCESRYHSYELETLAVVRAVEHFRHYLYGRKFTVYTDCNALKASKSKVDLTPRVHRWWAILQAYDFDIIYREGRNMEHADYLSRNPQPERVVSDLAVDSSQSISANTDVTSSKSVKFVELHEGWLAVEQKRDKEIQDLVAKFLSKELPDTVAQTYDVRNGILYRKISRNKLTAWLPIVPRSLIWTLINHIHTEIQHLGPDKTLDKIYDQYWFPEMSKCVRRFVDSCIVCKASKGPSGAQPIRLHSIPKISVPWHTVHIDFTGKLSGKSDQKEYCSVIIDSFTKYVLLEHTTSLDAASAITALKNAVCLFGAPKRVIADQGRCYISSDFKSFCAQHGIELHFIATGSSRANGQVERVMRTLKSLLTIIENDPHKTWRDELGSVQLALNSTRSTVTKYTPTELMFGVQANSLGIHQITPRNEPGRPIERLNVESIRADALKNIEKAARADTIRFNRGRASIHPFSKGDYVFVKSSERNQTKLDRKFRGPFVITRVLENDRYEVRSVDGSRRTLKYSHENLRSVPNGHEGLTELAASIMAPEEAVTAPDEQSGSDHDDNSETLSARSFDTLTADSTTLTAHSGPASVRSETISVDSEDEGPVTFEVEAEVHHSGW